MESHENPEKWIIKPSLRTYQPKADKHQWNTCKKDKENIACFILHFEKNFNQFPTVNFNAFDMIKTTPPTPSMDKKLTFVEFDSAIKCMKWHSAPGLNGISPNTIKSLNDRNEEILYKLMFQYFEEGLDAQAKLIPSPKKRNTQSHWMEINQFDITSKIVSIPINQRLQHILEKVGLSLGGQGCQDSLFTLKTYLQT